MSWYPTYLLELCGFLRRDIMKQRAADMNHFLSPKVIYVLSVKASWNNMYEVILYCPREFPSHYIKSKYHQGWSTTDANRQERWNTPKPPTAKTNGPYFSDVNFNPRKHKCDDVGAKKWSHFGSKNWSQIRSQKWSVFWSQKWPLPAALW